ncbi:TetR/AcrR family transcriptional regulator [Rathayibacter soli]|uniref:TetR/AcrR family transcriptional regulator n=1 Tax=Rathayibacter soli TaxID=3144168 RepID=UPI0027E4BC2A|nr:TetR/AcrR family transcriptional regulator [Glaciibacter superstes]
MAARGSYAKGIAKRDQILTTALDVIARQGYRKASIRELAAAVDLSQTGLLHYFGTKEDLFIEVLRKRDQLDVEAYGVSDHGPATGTGSGTGTDTGADIIGALLRVVRHNADVPGLVRLYTQFSAEATEPDHPAHEYFRERSATFRFTVAAAIRQQQRAGKLASSLDPDRIAMLLIAAIDGLQTQWMLDDSVDMAAHVAQLWDYLTRASHAAEA